MKNKGLTLTMIFKASSLNYGESAGNMGVLKKFTRGDGTEFTRVSRQALIYDLRNQMGEKRAPTGIDDKNKSVIQYLKDTSIEDYPEIDLFGYMKTEANTNGLKRNAVVRVTDALSLEEYRQDSDFLTNMGMADIARQLLDGKEADKLNNNIAQAEIHTSLYKYTIAIDLDRVGIDNEMPDHPVDLPAEEKARRVKVLLDTIMTHYRDIRGRREDLSPLFMVGGVYDVKSPYFNNVVGLEKDTLNLDTTAIKTTLDRDLKGTTVLGYVDNTFANNAQVKEELAPTDVNTAMESIKKEVDKYYGI